MSLSDLASLGSFVSGIAVLASLVYLGIQTRQNTRNTRALIHQGAAARTNSILLGLMDSNYMAAWIEGNGMEATPAAVRERQFLAHCGIALNALEDHFLQHGEGLLNDEQFNRNMETFRGLLGEPGMRAFWLSQRAVTLRVAPRFAAFVDSLCTEDASTFKNTV
jgi:hypothetical protein